MEYQQTWQDTEHLWAKPVSQLQSKKARGKATATGRQKHVTAARSHFRVQPLVYSRLYYSQLFIRFKSFLNMQTSRSSRVAIRRKLRASLRHVGKLKGRPQEQAQGSLGGFNRMSIPCKTIPGRPHPMPVVAGN